MAKRIIDLANPGGWIARETIFAFANMLVFGNNVDKQYEKEFKKVGDKVIIRKRVQFDSIDGFDTGGDITGQVQPIDERNATLTVNANPIVPFEADDHDMALSIDDFRERYIMEAAIKLANQTDLAIAKTTLKFSNVVGTAGTTPDDYDAVAAAAEVLDNMSVPRDGRRNFIINPKANRKLTGGLVGQFNPQDASGMAFKQGLINRSAGFDILMSQNVISHLDGTQDKTGQISGGSQVGASINLKGFTPGNQLLTNAIVTFDGSNAVNRFTKEDTGVLMQFRVTADATADGSGNMTIQIDPPIEVTGPYQNVTVSPSDGASVVVATYGSATPPTRGYANVAFHKNAITIATIPLLQPKGFDIAEVVSYNGWTMRYVRGWDILTAQWISRMELLFAVDVLEPTAGVRVLG